MSETLIFVIAFSTGFILGFLPLLLQKQFYPCWRCNGLGYVKVKEKTDHGGGLTTELEESKLCEVCNGNTYLKQNPIQRAISKKRGEKIHRTME